MRKERQRESVGGALFKLQVPSGLLAKRKVATRHSPASPLLCFPGVSVIKNLPASSGGFNPWVGKIPWRRKWQPTPVFLPGNSHGQRSLAGYSPWGHKTVRHDLVTKQQHLPTSPVIPDIFFFSGTRKILR